MTAQEIAQKAYDAAHISASHIVSTGAQHVPMMVLQTKTGIDIMPVGFLPKAMVTGFHRFLATKPETVSATLVVEGWGVERKMEGPKVSPAEAVEKLEREGFRADEQPDRHEVIVFSVYVGLTQFTAFCKIDRSTGKLEKAPLTQATAENTAGQLFKPAPKPN
jgi:hypothetical protein